MTKAPTPAKTSKGQSDNTQKKPPYIDNKPTITPSGEVIKIDTNTAQVINII